MDRISSQQITLRKSDIGQTGARVRHTATPAVKSRPKYFLLGKVIKIFFSVGPLRRSQVGQRHQPDHQIHPRQRKHPYEKLIGRNRGTGNGIFSESHVAAGSSPNVHVAAPRIETGGWKPIEKEEEDVTDSKEGVNEIKDAVV